LRGRPLLRFGSYSTTIVLFELVLERPNSFGGFSSGSSGSTSIGSYIYGFTCSTSRDASAALNGSISCLD
jgi:hypothetical protein